MRPRRGPPTHLEAEEGGVDGLLLGGGVEGGGVEGGQALKEITTALGLV